MNEAKNPARERELDKTTALYNAATDYAAYVNSEKHDFDEGMKLSDALEAAAVSYAEIAGDRQPAMSKTAETQHVGISDLLAGERVSEKDFVFLDHAYRPYRVRDVNGTLWLHYWHADKKWVTKRTVSDDEAMQWIESALPPAQAKLYEAGVPFLAS